MTRALNSLPRVLVFQQRLGLLLADDGGFDLGRVHVHVQLPPNEEANRSGKLGLGFQHLWGLFLNDEGAAGQKKKEQTTVKKV